MKPGLEIGASWEFTARVSEDMQARFEDEVVHPLYSTAAMIHHMEWAARQHILPYLEEGEEGVGYHVDVRHLSPAPIGSMVRVSATVTDIQPRRITCQVEAWLGDRKIGDGRFTQALVPLAVLHNRYSRLDLPRSPDDPEPAVLNSMDSKSRLQLEVVKWETGLFPCTRYDEWLVCRAVLETTGRQLQHEGAFLLRFELEDWLHAVQGLLSGEKSGFQSDHLEPVLEIFMEATEPGEFRADITFTRPASQGGWAGESVSVRMELTQKVLADFCKQLERQLEGFPSML